MQGLRRAFVEATCVTHNGAASVRRTWTAVSKMEQGNGILGVRRAEIRPDLGGLSLTSVPKRFA